MTRTGRAPLAAIPHRLINDSSVSLAAKGLYAFISAQDDADAGLSIRAIASRIKEGRACVSARLKELADAGWAVKTSGLDGTDSYALRFIL